MHGVAYAGKAPAGAFLLFGIVKTGDGVSALHFLCHPRRCGPISLRLKIHKMLFCKGLR